MDSNLNSQLILYQTEDGQTHIQVIMQDETVWLTQKEMAELFQRDQSVISRHVNNVFQEGELDEESNMQKMHIANSDKPVAFYNLNVIISVGYRVKSHRGTQFCVFRPMPINDSGLCRSQIPADVDQPFWSMPINHFSQAVV